MRKTQTCRTERDAMRALDNMKKPFGFRAGHAGQWNAEGKQLVESGIDYNKDHTFTAYIITR